MKQKILVINSEEKLLYRDYKMRQECMHAVYKDFICVCIHVEDCDIYVRKPFMKIRKLKISLLH